LQLDTMGAAPDDAQHLPRSNPRLASSVCYPTPVFPAHHGSEVWCLYGALCLTAALLTGKGLPGSYSGLALLFVALAGVCCVLALRSRGPARPSVNSRLTVLFWAVLAIHVVVAIVVVRRIPERVNDVYFFQSGAAKALLHGVNPYTITHADPDPQHSWYFYGPGISENGRIHVGFPYLPVSLLLVLPGYLAGDVRYALIAALLVSALLMRQIRKDGFMLLVVSVLLLNPVTFFLLAMSWTEPLVLMLLCGTILAAVRKSRWLPVVFGLLLASKQYVPIIIPFTGLLAPAFGVKKQVKLIVQACLAALVTTLPFALWNFQHFWHDTVTFQILQPFRPDSLSFSVLTKRLGLPSIPLAVVAAVCLATIIWSLAAVRRKEPANFACGFALVLLVFFVLNKQAFCQYYFLVMGCLLTAAVAAAWPEEVLLQAPGQGEEEPRLAGMQQE
jgi:hypothetical protein